jgi:hypothetical protein
MKAIQLSTVRRSILAISVLILGWLFTQVPRRGRRRPDTKRFELSRLAKFIRRALEDHYGCVREIVALAAPRL